MSSSSKRPSLPLVFAFMALVFTVVGAVLIGVGFNVRDAMTEGTEGTFTPVTQKCERVLRMSTNGSTYRDKCSWNGQFRASDSVVDDAHLEDDLGTRRGDAAPDPVDAVLGSDGKIYLDSAGSWVLWIIGGGTCVPIGVGLGVAGIVSAARKRRRRAGGAWPGPDANAWPGYVTDAPGPPTRYGP